MTLLTRRPLKDCSTTRLKLRGSARLERQGAGVARNYFAPACRYAVRIDQRDWWRGLDSNQCSLRRQIYSLMDLTTLPPLHILPGRKRSALASRRAVYGGLSQRCQHPCCDRAQEIGSVRILWKVEASRTCQPGAVRANRCQWLRPQGGYSSMVEQQPSKLNTRVRFPLPAPNN